MHALVARSLHTLLRMSKHAFIRNAADEGLHAHNVLSHRLMVGAGN